MNIDEKIKKKRVWPLVIMVALIIGFGWFIKTMYSYYSRIQEGTLDLASFATGELTKTEGSAVVGAPNLAIVENFSDDPKTGSLNAKLKIVAFEDFQCPYCLKAFPIIKSVLNNYSDKILFVYRDFPINEAHSDAQKAAEAGQCAYEQGKFWEYHDKLFMNQKALSVPDLQRYALEIGLNDEDFEECLNSGRYESEVKADFEDGVKAGVSGTPTFFFNGNKVAGVLSFDAFRQIIEYFDK